MHLVPNTSPFSSPKNVPFRPFLALFDPNVPSFALMPFVLDPSQLNSNRMTQIASQLSSQRPKCSEIVTNSSSMPWIHHNSNTTRLNSIRKSLNSPSSRRNSTRRTSNRLKDVTTCPQIVPSFNKCVELIADRPIYSHIFPNRLNSPQIALIIIIVSRLSHPIILSKLFSM